MRQVSQEEAEDILARLIAVLVGDFHFVGKAGDHLGAYVQKEVPTSHPRELRIFAEGIAWGLSNQQIEVIASPELGAVLLGGMVAEELGVDFAIIEKENAADQMLVRRPAFKAVVKDRRVAIVEDVVTKGESTRQSAAAIRQAGGEVAAVSALYNRSGQTAQSLGVPVFVPLVDRKLEDYPWNKCEHCANGVPIVLNVGHGAGFREEHPEVDVPYVEL